MCQLLQVLQLRQQLGNTRCSTCNAAGLQLQVLQPGLASQRSCLHII
jgi:hypothetical protein